MQSPLIRARRWLGPALVALALLACARARSTPTPAGYGDSPGLPTAAPPAAAMPIAPTPAAEPIVKLSAADAYLTAETAAGRFSGAVLVARDGHVLLEKGYGLADRESGLANTPRTRFHIASLTKQFTAMAILQLQERGKLRVADRIASYLPDCPLAWRAITIEELLTHTSGLEDYFGLDGVDALLTHPVTPAEILDLVRDQPLLFAAGSSCSYSNSGYVVLGQLIERTSGGSYADAIETNILTPLGMADTTYGPSCPPGACAVGYETAWVRAPDADLSVGYAAGGLCSTVEDLYRWDQALYTTQLCNQQSLDAMFSPHWQVTDGVAFGYGWVIRDTAGRRRIAHSGLLYGYSAIIARFPDERATIIMLSNLEDAPLAGYLDVLAGQLFD